MKYYFDLTSDGLGLRFLLLKLIKRGELTELSSQQRRAYGCQANDETCVHTFHTHTHLFENYGYKAKRHYCMYHTAAT